MLQVHEGYEAMQHDLLLQPGAVHSQVEGPPTLVNARRDLARRAHTNPPVATLEKGGCREATRAVAPNQLAILHALLHAIGGLQLNQAELTPLAQGALAPMWAAKCRPLRMHNASFQHAGAAILGGVGIRKDEP
jgi:hypothetical protein